jgi:hypothetical protein
MSELTTNTRTADKRIGIHNAPMNPMVFFLRALTVDVADDPSA